MKTIEEKVIEEVGMANLPLIIHKLYKLHHGKLQLIDIGGDCMFRFGDTNVANVSYLATYIHFIEMKNNILRIEGNVSWPFVIKDLFKLYITVNGEKQQCIMYDAGFDLKIKKDIYETRTAFSYELELLPNINEYEFTFIYECNGIECCSGKINSMRFSPVADVIESQYAERDGWIIQIKKNKLLLKYENEQREEVYEKKYQSAICDKEVNALRNLYFFRIKQKMRPIWLFMDRIDKADDNGEAFFRYVVSQKPNVDCYFVINKSTHDYERISKVGNVIDAMSEEHKVLLLLSDYLFTSQLNGWVENPFGNKEECFRDLYHQNKVVFLQHGVTKDNQTKWLNRFNQNLYAIVTSSELEKNSFMEYPYHYSEKQIWNVGMPRLDLLYNDESRYILFMPTWRQAVMEQKLDLESGTYRWYPKETFIESDYCKYYSEILSNEDFIEECRKNGYEVVFMPHPIVRPYIDKFKISNKVKRFDYKDRWRDIFAKSSVMITDYSSVAFDFAYLKKPIIYFQFDKNKFFDLHTYSQGYFNYKTMGFGKIVKSKRALIREIQKEMKHNFRVQDTYKERVEKFYTFRDQNCSKRIYEKL